MKTAKLLLTGAILAAVFSFYGCAKAGIGGPSYAVDGIGDGTQVVPTSASTAIGSIAGNFDGNKNTLTGTIKWSSLSGSPTAIHIHNASPGRNGYPTFILAKIPHGITDSINFSSAFTESQETGMKPGTYYFDIHTSAYPNGEIRGQLIAH